MKISTFIKRGISKFGRLPVIKDVLLIGKDKTAITKFWLEKKQRTESSATFEKCQSLEDYFQFTTMMFGSHQIKHEILSFLEFANYEKPKYACEIGTANGGTNFLLSQALPSVSTIIGVDLYVKNQAQLKYFSRENQGIYFVNGSSYATQTVEKVKNILENNKLDLLFIDGDHTYEGVKQDFLKYRHLVREGGIIAFHDIIPDYLTRYGRQTYRWVGDVPRFWSKIKLAYPCYEFVEDPEQDGLGIGAIRYSENNELPNDL